MRELFNPDKESKQMSRPMKGKGYELYIRALEEGDEVNPQKEIAFKNEREFNYAAAVYLDCSMLSAELRAAIIRELAAGNTVVLSWGIREKIVNRPQLATPDWGPRH